MEKQKGGGEGKKFNMKEKMAAAREFMTDVVKNKKIREAKRKGVGNWVELMIEAKGAWPNNPHKQIAYLFAKGKVIAATGIKRESADKTRQDMSEHLFKAVRELKEVGMPIRNVSELDSKHVMALIKKWEATPLEWKTIEVRVSSLRRVLDFLNKPNIIPKRGAFHKWLDENGVTVHHSRKSRDSETSKAWTAHGVDPQEVMDRVNEGDPLIGLLMELQLAFGLRKQESYKLEPRSSDEGMRLYIWQGAKGGRARPIDFDDDPMIAEWQRDLLERAKVFALKHPQRRLSVPGLTDDQMNSRFNNVMIKYGVTQKELGVTAHGLRHEFAARRFSAASGLPPQNVGTVPASVYVEQKENVKAARIKTSEALGHWREDITTSYVGSTSKLQKLSRQRMDTWVRRFEDDADLMGEIAKIDVKNLWLVGKAGNGLVMQPNTPLEVQVCFNSLDDQVWSRMDKLEQRMVLSLGRPVRVSIVRNDVTPGDALEIFVPKTGMGMAVGGNEPVKSADAA
jgi:integrase